MTAAATGRQRKIAADAEAKRGAGVNLAELGSADARAFFSRLFHAFVAVEAYNYPAKSHDGTGRAGKPGSRPPGLEHCPHEAKEALGVIKYAAERMERIQSRARVREHESEPAQSWAGKEYAIPASQMAEGEAVRDETPADGVWKAS